jgi:aspartate-semialdehyde dehydrogenase
VVPEINEDSLDDHQGIIANPNCSTAQMVLPLKVLHDKVGIKRVVVSTYQSTSGGGKDAMNELLDQSSILLNGKQVEPKVFSKQISFNVIPQIDEFLENGYTKEEMKMIEETQKILGDDQIAVTATTVRVPVFIGHAESINIELKGDASVGDIKQWLGEADGISVMDDPSNGIYPTPIDVAGKDDVYIGRIRKDLSVENGVEMFVVADNLRKGAALNAVQISESLHRQGLLNTK